MLIYNLYPTLAGKLTSWKEHIQRASSMGFDWIFVNPIQLPGLSGSLYSIKDYYELNPLLIDPGSPVPPDGQIKEAIAIASDMGMSMMIDLVINHSAIDSPLVTQHPEWYAKDKDGKVAHPFAMDGKKKVVWGDLAKFDYSNTTDPEGLYTYFREVVEHLVGLGFRGFRCDAAYQVPGDVWKRLMSDIKSAHPNTVFAAETLGCSPEATLETARAGFDYIFNSSKWWDFKGSWLIEQYELLRTTCPSISFPESHDTMRLAEEYNGNTAMLKQMYAFSAFFSAGAMMPMGYEFGFRKALHVVKTRPGDWEESDIDLSQYISDINTIKNSHEAFLTEAPTEILKYKEKSNLLLMRKHTISGDEAALIVINRELNKPRSFTLEEFGLISGIKGAFNCAMPGCACREDIKDMELELEPGGCIVLYGRSR